MYIDTHAHLSFPDFASDLPATVARANAAGVTQIVSVATDLADARRVLAVAGEYPGVFASVGLHPNHISDSWRADMQELAALAGQPKVVAIGETGLDYYRSRDHATTQKEMFQAHLDLARQRRLPVIIHCRAADADTLAMVRANVPDWRPWGVMHCFAGNTEVAWECIELGLLISFTGIVTFKNADALRVVAGAVPLESLVLETDSPYLAPVPQRGQRNEPAFIPHIAGALAQIKNVPVEELARITSANARRLFKLPGF